MTMRGMRTMTAASAGSKVSGELFNTGEPCNTPDDFERRNREHQDRVVELVRSRERLGEPLDLIHDMSGSFWSRAAELDVPVLATLHLPRNFYSRSVFENVPGNVSFNCVSGAQARSFAELNPAIVQNGIPLERFEPNIRSRSGLLWLGRICEEKGPHLALDIAERAKEPITLAGQLYPFSYHQQYFDREIRPRLEQMPDAIFISTPTAEEKRRLLRDAKAVLITSIVDETSSLVAMEAAASGTPVVAFPRGALPEIVKDEVTGFLVDGVEVAVEALRRVGRIDPLICVTQAEKMFSSKKMAEGYERLYADVCASSTHVTYAAEGTSTPSRAKPARGGDPGGCGPL